MNLLLISTIAYTSSSSSSTSTLLWLALPVLAFIGTYFGIYRYYRNTDKNFKFEQETAIQTKNMMSSDYIVGSRNGTTDKYIDNRNSNNHRKRVLRITKIPGQE